MRPATRRRTTRRPLGAGISVLAVAALIAGASLIGAVAGASSSLTATVAKRPAPLHIGTARSATLSGRRILVTARGRTLYTLSAETHGTFICTDKACLSVWKPLKLKKGQKATGVAKLGAIVRPDGRRQVTYKGLPLYTFTHDTSKGDVSGEGFQDVGTWHAALAPKKK